MRRIVYSCGGASGASSLKGASAAASACVGDVVVVQPLDELDRLAFAAVAEPVELVDDFGAGPVEGDLSAGGNGGVVQALFEGGDVLRQAVVADDELELAGVFADGELDRA